MLNTQWINDNSYLLLSNDAIKGLLAVNSSLTYEAPYFGKTTYLLGEKKFNVVYTNNDFNQDAYASIENEFLETDFWRDILQPFLSVSKRDGIKIPFKPNRLRIALNYFWDYNKIDTDIFIHKALPKVDPPPIKKQKNFSILSRI